MYRFPPESANLRLRDCAELVYILIGDLRDVLEESPSEQTRHWLAVLLDTMLETVPEEFSLKSDGGYLSDVLHDFPHWDARVELLEDQYFSLYLQLRRLREQVKLQITYEETASSLRDDLGSWITAFQEFRSQERDLVQTAANLTVGAGD